MAKCCIVEMDLTKRNIMPFRPFMQCFEKRTYPKLFFECYMMPTQTQHAKMAVPQTSQRDRTSQRDVSQIIELKFYMDQEYHSDFVSLADCLSPTLPQLFKPFPALRLEMNDMIIKFNDKDVRDKTPEYIRDLLIRLDVNYKEPMYESENTLVITFIKGKDFRPERHLIKVSIQSKAIKKLLGSL